MNTRQQQVEPIPNTLYSKKGFRFRVDSVDNGQVYLVRWREDGASDELGIPMRCPISQWTEQMQDAEKL